MRLLFVFIILSAFAQIKAQNNNIGIGTTSPHPSAAIDIYSNNKGLLIPRLSANDRINISNPANGLLVFDTTSTQLYIYVNPAIEWKALSIENFFFGDRDGDGLGDKFKAINSMNPLPGYVSDSTDCNDDNPTLPKSFYRDADNDNGLNFNDSIVGCIPAIGYKDVEALILSYFEIDLMLRDREDFEDCNDNNQNIGPFIQEECNGIDDDCDLIIDEGVLLRWFYDNDSDGYGDVNIDSFSCIQPENYVLGQIFLNGSNGGYFLQTDCSDNNDAIYPSGLEICDGLDNDCDALIDDLANVYYLDDDGDGFGDPNIIISVCPIPFNYVTNNIDCDDSNFSLNPSSEELCNNIDDDCDGAIDEFINVYVLDNDGDGFAILDSIVQTCTPATGYILYNQGMIPDCNDNDNNIYSEANEVCNNGIDDDCDEEIDDLKIWVADLDNDGYFDNNNTIQSCTQPNLYVDINQVFGIIDCNDLNPSIPTEFENCTNNIDDNCNGSIDEESTWYRDQDRDGYGNFSITLVQCEQPMNYVLNDGDCNDNNIAINSGIDEICNNEIDDDCDGFTDERYYLDNDNDGFVNFDSFVCIATPNYINNSSLDCDDNNPNINTNALEIVDGIDNDCNGLIDDVPWYPDFDGDGYGSNDLIQLYYPLANFVQNNLDCDDNNVNVNPTSLEVCDFLDNNCDGPIDNNTGELWYYDADNDGFGSPFVFLQSCQNSVLFFVQNNSDCNDDNSNTNPNITELCDNIDNNCDGQIDESFNLETDPLNCGQCGIVCFFPNAQTNCLTGQCEITSCDSGFVDCNNDDSDGCEVNLASGTHCFINGVCYNNGETNPNAECLECNTTVNNMIWTPKIAGTTCTTGTCDGNGNCNN